ncbi:unnamed protein product, partial [Enterobius vermicularis]|uniref:Secreted protein n=1 Tax=Enterobius vermicularis TaxID=51028 RepID=A0A0N4UTB0_ENTVE
DCDSELCGCSVGAAVSACSDDIGEGSLFLVVVGATVVKVIHCVCSFSVCVSECLDVIVEVVSAVEVSPRSALECEYCVCRSAVSVFAFFCVTVDGWLFIALHGPSVFELGFGVGECSVV